MFYFYLKKLFLNDHYNCENDLIYIHEVAFKS